MNQGGPAVLLIEDDASIRKFLRISLEANGYQVHEARLGEVGLRMCAELGPALVILDLGLPDIEGQAVITRLREWSEVPVIVLSVRSDERQKVAVLDAGANDYVTKPFGISELLARLRVLLRGGGQSEADTAVLSAGGLRMDLLRRRVWIEDSEVHLSRKEYELLRLFVQNRGRVLTHQQILAAVWGVERGAETQNLRVLVAALRQKLGDEPSRPRFLITEPGVGYRFADS